MKWQAVVPVVISILVIIAVAVVQRYSKMVAAITATMPLNIPLSLWVVAAANGGDRPGTARFSDGLLLGIGPTVVFVVAAWLAARAGWRVAAVIGTGYAAWGLALIALFGARRWLGLS